MILKALLCYNTKVKEGGEQKWVRKTENRNNLELKCSVCGFIIRPTEKNKAKTPERLEIKNSVKNVIKHKLLTKRNR